jgi:hypothetical protein
MNKYANEQIIRQKFRIEYQSNLERYPNAVLKSVVSALVFAKKCWEQDGSALMTVKEFECIILSELLQLKKTTVTSSMAI